jgi:hypothetical protein
MKTTYDLKQELKLIRGEEWRGGQLPHPFHFRQFTIKLSLFTQIVTVHPSYQNVLSFYARELKWQFTSKLRLFAPVTSTTIFQLRPAHQQYPDASMPRDRAPVWPISRDGTATPFRFIFNPVLLTGSGDGVLSEAKTSSLWILSLFCMRQWRRKLKTLSPFFDNKHIILS